MINNNSAFAVLRVLPLLLLSSCATHAVNQTPAVQVAPPTEFSVTTNASTLNTPWWESFQRPALNSLMAEALNANFDVIQALAALEQGLALASQTGSARFPQLDIEGNSAQRWQDGDRQSATAGIGAALDWELDVWKRIGNAALSDQLQAQALAADLEALKLSLSAEVANAYFGIVAAKEQISLLKAQIKLDQDLEEILKWRLESGVGNRVDVLQQQARVAESESLIPVAESALAVFENRLDVLTGATPDAKPQIIQPDSLSVSAELPALGVPAALLLNRPDLLAARNQLVAADADIAAAIADRLPRITLTSSFGWEDAASFTGPAGLIMGSFVQPLLDWGQRKAEVARNKALYQQRLASYTQGFLEAVEDVENALVQETKQREYLAKLSSQRQILQEAADIAEQRYRNGVDDYQPVLAALRELRQVERSLVSENLNLISIRIDLFRAIGGPVAAPRGDTDTAVPNE